MGLKADVDFMRELQAVQNLGQVQAGGEFPLVVTNGDSEHDNSIHNKRGIVNRGRSERKPINYGEKLLVIKNRGR